MEPVKAKKEPQKDDAENCDWIIVRGVPVRLGRRMAYALLIVHSLGWAAVASGVWMLTRHAADIKLILGR